MRLKIKNPSITLFFSAVFDVFFSLDSLDKKHFFFSWIIVTCFRRLLELWHRFGFKKNIIRLVFMFNDDHYKTTESIHSLVHCVLHMCKSNSNNFHPLLCTAQKLIRDYLSWHILSLSMLKKYYEREKKSKKISSRSIGVNRKWISDCTTLLGTWNEQWRDSLCWMQSFNLPSRVEIAKEEKNGALEFRNLILLYCFSGHSIKHKQIVSSREFSILFAVCLMTEILNIECHVPNYQEMLISGGAWNEISPWTTSQKSHWNIFFLFLFFR